MQTSGQEGEGKRKEKTGEEEEEEEAPVSVCMSVLTQSKSICHQDCHCGTKREGSLPGRTHSEKWRETRQAQGGMVAFRSNVDGGSGNLLLTPPTKLQAHLPKS